MIAIFLQQQAEHFAHTQEQRIFLDSIVFEDERAFERVMYGETVHEILLGGDFGVCCFGLLALLGTKRMWQVLQDFGYEAQSRVYFALERDQAPHQDIQGLARMTVLGVATALCDKERLLELVGFLKCDLSKEAAFAERGVSCATFGLMHSEPDVFDYLKQQWVEELSEASGQSQTFYTGVVPTLRLKTIEYCARWGLDEEATTETIARMNDVVEAFLKSIVGTGSSMEDIVQRMPRLGMFGTEAYIQHALRQNPETTHWTTNHLLSLEARDQWSACAFLCQKAPATHVWALGEQLLQRLAFHQFEPSNGLFLVWCALMERVKKDAPCVFERIPVSYQRGAFLSNRTKEEKERALLWAQTFSFQNPKNASPARKM